MTEQSRKLKDDELEIIFGDDKDRAHNLQGDIIVHEVHVTGPDKSDLDARIEALKKHSVLNIEVIKACQKMFKQRYNDMVCLYIENSHERLNELEEAMDDEDMVSMIRPAHTLKVTSVQMGASQLFFMAKELETFLKGIARQMPAEIALVQVRGMIDQIEIVLRETEGTFTQLVSLESVETDKEG